MRTWIGVLAVGLAAALAWAIWAGRGTQPAGTLPFAGEGNQVQNDASPAGVPARPPRRRTSAVEPAGSAGDSTLEPGAPTTTGGVTILLLDPEGAPRPDAELGIQWRRGEGDHVDATGRTDASGRIATGIPDPIRIEGIWLPEDSRGRILAAEGPFEADPARPGFVVVRMPRPAQVHGTVLDVDGGPIDGAVVVIDSEGELGSDPYARMLGLGEIEVPVAQDGSWSFEAFEGGCTFTARAAGFDPIATAHVCLDAGRENPPVDLALCGEAREVRVIVRAVGGSPQEPVWVGARRSDSKREIARAAPPGTRLEPHPMHSRGEELEPGVFLLRLSRSGGWIASAHTMGAREGATATVPTDKDEMVLDLLPRGQDPDGVILKGRVIVPGEPPLSTSVQILYGPDLRRSGEAWADSQGRFELRADRKEAQEVRLLARKKGFGCAGVGPISLASPPAWIEITLEPELRIEGVIVDGEGRPAWASVLLRPEGGFFRSLPGQPVGGATGSWSLDRPGVSGCSPDDVCFLAVGLPAGRYELQAWSRDARLPPARLVAEAGDEHVRLVLSLGFEGLGSIDGVVRDALTRLPIAGARVAVGPADGEDGTGAETRSGMDGGFVFVGRRSEDLDLYVDAAGYAIFESQVAVRAPARMNFDVDLLPARTLRILVVAAEGTPRANVAITAFDDSNRATSLRDLYGHDVGPEVRTDAAGRADLFGLPATRLRLRLTSALDPRDDFAVETSFGESRSDEIETTEIEIDLAAPVSGIRRVVVGR